MKRSLDRNGNSSPRKRFRDVERTSERERRGKEGSERREGDRDRVDRELSDRWVERGSERDRGSREDPRVGRNTTPKEDWHKTTHRNKFDSGEGDRNHERKEQGGRSDRDGGVERTSEWERSGRGGSKRWEGDRVDRDREGKLAIGSNRRGERDSERDRESREDQRGGRNTTPKEDRKDYDSARDRDQDGNRDQGGDRGRRYTGQRPFRGEEIRNHIAPRRQQKGTITPQHRQLQQQICSCQSLLQLLETVDRAEDMNHVNVSTAIHRSAKHFKREAKSGRTLLDDSRFQRSFDIQCARHVCSMYSPMC